MTCLRFSVVYADDDESVRTTISAVLADAGVDVHVGKGGAEAIALCQSVNPDAVLLDLGMPDVDGFEAARRLRQNPYFVHLRLVALTGRSTSEAREKALAAGFDEFLSKPVTCDVLLRALRGAQA